MRVRPLSNSNEPPAPGPMANLGTSSNAEMAPLHIGPVESRDVEDDSTASGERSHASRLIAA